MVVRFVAGGVLRLATPNGDIAYAAMLNMRPYFAFYAEGAATVVEGSRLIFGDPLLFVVAVHNSAYSKGRWGDILYRLNKLNCP
jgi:hypothetical protein